MTLKGKYALVTGGSRGIGRGIVLKLAQSGAKVAVHYYQKEDQAKATLEKLRAAGTDGFLVQADVCKPEEIRRMFAHVKSEFGALDIFVNNARPEVPTFYDGPMTISLDMFDFAMDSQAKAFLVAVREALPMMRDGGRIIAMTYAPGGRFGSWQPWVAMGAAKAALERSEEHTSELQSPCNLVCRLLLEKKKKKRRDDMSVVEKEEKDNCAHGRDTHVSRSAEQIQ